MDYLKMLACLILTVLMGKWLHWYILKSNTGSFHSFCRICLKLNFLYSSITMQNDTLNLSPPPQNHQFSKPTLLSSVQYQYIFHNFHVDSNFTSPALLNNLYIKEKKLWYILHNRENMTLNFKPKGLQNVWWQGQWVIYVLTHSHAPPAEHIFR